MNVKKFFVEKLCFWRMRDEGPRFRGATDSFEIAVHKLRCKKNAIIRQIARQNIKIKFYPEAVLTKIASYYNVPQESSFFVEVYKKPFYLAIRWDAKQQCFLIEPDASWLE